MKRILLILLIIAALAVPAFSQFRIDVNLQLPVTFGVIYQGDITIFEEATEFFRTFPIPIPSGSFYYNFPIGSVNLSAGVKIYSFILINGMYPVVQAEFDLHPFYIQAELGGLLFWAFGAVVPASEPVFGKVFLPDVSAYFGFGESGDFRLGLGCMGFYVPEVITDGMIIVPYIAGEWSIDIE